MTMIGLDKLVETPYLMEIVVQVLPLMSIKASEINTLRKTFINNFSKLFSNYLERIFTIKKY